MPARNIQSRLTDRRFACIIHENYIFIHKHFKANGFEISTRPSADGLAQG